MMGYGNKSLNDLRDEALKIAVEHGFASASVAEDIALMHSELSEALEDHRAGDAPDKIWYEEKGASGQRFLTMFPKVDTAFDVDHPRKPCGIPSELADVIIRVLHFAGKHEIDIEQAVREKMLYNETREYKHGGKKL